MFSIRFRRVRRRRIRRRHVRHRNDFCLSRQNRLSYILDIWSKEYIGLTKCTGWTSNDLDPRPRLAKFAFLHDTVRITHPITTKLSSVIALVMVITWLDFEKKSARNCYLAIFLYQFRMCFFKVKHYFGHIPGMVVRLMWNEKEVHRLDTEYNMWPWPFYLTHDLDLVYFNVKFRNSCISGIVGLIDLKWKGSESMGYWADCMTLPFDHIHNLTRSFKVRVRNSLISGMEQPIDMYQK